VATLNMDQITDAKNPKSFVFFLDKIPSTLRHLQQNLDNIMQHLR
jgi:ribosome biogenesis protein SSF1/2